MDGKQSHSLLEVLPFFQLVSFGGEEVSGMDKFLKNASACNKCASSENLCKLIQASPIQMEFMENVPSAN